MVRRALRRLPARRAGALDTDAFFRANPEVSLWGSLADGARAELVRLLGLVADHPGPVIEIGTLFGLTTQLLVAHAAPQQQVITVDNFCWNPFGMPRAQHETFTDYVLYDATRRGAAQLHKGDSAAFFDSYDGEPPALIFIDAGHHYVAVREDIKRARSVGAELICGDDYRPLFPGVRRAVDEEFGEPHVAWGIWSPERA